MLPFSHMKVRIHHTQPLIPHGNAHGQKAHRRPHSMNTNTCNTSDTTISVRKMVSVGSAAGYLCEVGAKYPTQFKRHAKQAYTDLTCGVRIIIEQAVPVPCNQHTGQR